MLHTYVNHHVGVFYHHFAPSLSSKVSLKCVFKLMNVAVTLTQKKNLLFWCTLIVSLKMKKKSCVQWCKLELSPWGCSKKSFYVLSHCQGDKKALVELKFMAPFCFDWRIRQSSRDCVGVFYRYLWVGGPTKVRGHKEVHHTF